ncbi:MAG TPA: hypothetical protein VFM46_12040, partial [Pseudomonadales bacterium]|nr:hypothetical protein [Pseudomonadales bacterium]
MNTKSYSRFSSAVKSVQLRITTNSAPLAAVLAALISLHGCAVAPAPEPDVKTEGHWLNQAAAGSELAQQPQEKTSPAASWLNFNNPQLTEFLRKVETQNTDLQAAAERIQQARANSVIAS